MARSKKSPLLATPQGATTAAPPNPPDPPPAKHGPAGPAQTLYGFAHLIPFPALVTDERSRPQVRSDVRL